MYYANIELNTAKANESLERMENLIPPWKIPYGWELGADLATLFYRLGNRQRFQQLSDEVEQECRAAIEAGDVNVQSYYNPYRVLLQMYDMKREYGKSLELMKSLAEMYPNDPGLKQQIDTLERRVAEGKASVDTTKVPR
jgi:hypothetical protein